jgi:hypothetical protein
MAGLLTLFGGVGLLITASPAIGVAVVLLSALYFALAEIISYLAVIARNSRALESLKVIPTRSTTKWTLHLGNLTKRRGVVYECAVNPV